MRRRNERGGGEVGEGGRIAGGKRGVQGASGASENMKQWWRRGDGGRKEGSSRGFRGFGELEAMVAEDRSFETQIAYALFKIH